jgi:NADH-quinone oxidoreductase subunit C
MLQNINDYLRKKIKKCFVNDVTFAEYNNILSVTCTKEKILALIHYLKTDIEFRFTMLIDVFAVDYPELLNRFEINYCLLSIEKNYRINIKVNVEDGVDMPSIYYIYKNAGWLEREVWDMHGVKFSNNPDLRRILTDYGFEGHPLRKDFPLSGYNEVRYDLVKEEVVYEPLNLVQEYRDFDFISPWEGVVKELPGDEKAAQNIKESNEGKH